MDGGGGEIKEIGRGGGQIGKNGRELGKSKKWEGAGRN